MNRDTAWRELHYGDHVSEVAAVAGLLLWLDAVHRAHALHITSLGLVSVLRLPYFLGLTLVAFSFAVELVRGQLRSRHLVAVLALLAVYMFGTACAIEPIASLTDSWVHAGFIQYIVQHGHPLNNYDARFSWPGGFTLGAVMVSFVGKTTALSFLRWFPLFIELACLAPLIVIARSSGLSRRAGWLGIAIFYAVNWIYQDYFSPQALNYLFLLVVVAAVMANWQPRLESYLLPLRSGLRERGRRLRRTLTLARVRGVETTTTWKASTTLGLCALIGLVCLAAAMSHQLTPYALVLSLAACLLTRRLGRPELIVLAGVLAVGWLSLGASNYWVGHLSSIFGSVGQLSSTLGSNVTSRVSGNSTHLIIVELRILLTGGLLALAALGCLRRFTDSRTLELLSFVPFLLLAAQNYGGEGLLRVVLYGLPFTSFLAASAIVPRLDGPVRAFLPVIRWGRFERPVIGLLSFLVVLGFGLANSVVRGGNDAYEAFTSGELAAVNYAYAHVRAGETIGVVYPDLPIGQRDIRTVNVFAPGAGGATPSPKKLKRLFLRDEPAVIILSASQVAWGEQVAGYPVGWETTLKNSLLSAGYHVAKSWPTATVLQRAP